MAVEDEDPPPPPDDGGSNTASIQITAEADGEEVQVQWSGSNLDEATVYRLYRGLQAGFDTTGTFQVSLTANEYVDQGLETETSYYYRVAAMDQAGTAQMSSPTRSMVRSNGKIGLVANRYRFKNVARQYI
jgi:fibronectin type 3 domain-containing protein